jgi:hypothetical protein
VSDDAPPLHFAAGWTLLVVGGATTAAEVPSLCTRVPRLLGRGCVVVCDVSEVPAPDVAAVGALARLRLDARRRHAPLRIEPVSCDLGALLGWTGLAKAVLDA